MPDGRAELEYGETTGLVGSLTDVRFKLLAFVPTIAGTAVALLGRHARPAELLAVGALGLAATLGVVRYEMHNTELYEYALGRAVALERELGITLYTGRPTRRDRPLAAVYAAVLGAWSYLVAWGAFAAGGIGHPQQLGGAVGAAAAAAAWVALLRRPREPAPVSAAALPSAGA